MVWASLDESEARCEASGWLGFGMFWVWYETVLSLGHVHVASYRYRSLIEGLDASSRSLIEALYTLNPKPYIP